MNLTLVASLLLAFAPPPPPARRPTQSKLKQQVAVLTLVV
jgi:hypothetical protein